MAAGDKGFLIKVKGVITCMKTSGGFVYQGTDHGEVLKYNAAAKTVSKLASLGSPLRSIELYGTQLYCGLENGRLVTVATA